MKYLIHNARSAGRTTQSWKLILIWLREHWMDGEETSLYSANSDYYQLWSPVQSEIEEFPH